MRQLMIAIVTFFFAFCVRFIHGLRESEVFDEQDTALDLEQQEYLEKLKEIDLEFVNTFDLNPCSAEPIHCGQKYFHEVYEQFQVAQEIIIQGWWTMFDEKLFAPTMGDPPSVSLKELMVSAAERGAKIYFIFWQSAVSEKLGYGVQQPKWDIEKLGYDNIHMLIDTSRTAVMLGWSAHIKVTIFDRNVAYAGGIDLANTRLDTPQHLLPDPTRVPDTSNGEPQHGYGKPWQDMQVKVTGEAARDLATVAVERWWTFCESFFRKHTVQCNDENKPSLHGMGRLKVKMVAMPDLKRGSTVKLTLGHDKNETRDFKEVGEQKQVSLKGRHDLGKSMALEVKGSANSFWGGAKGENTMLLSDLADGLPHTLQIENGWEMEFQWDKTTAHEDWRASAREGAEQQCQVILSGDKLWFGASQPNRDMVNHYKRMIRGAQSSVYIENQYFSSHMDGCDKMKSTNDVAQELYNKITSKASNQEPFSAVVVFPLATEEAETHYGNLRTAECLYTALSDFWKANNIEAPLSDYFGIFHLANVISAPGENKSNAFYGIFVHSKLIVVDYDAAEGGEAIVASANINDRSLSGESDAEVGVLVKGGGFPNKMMRDLLQYHTGSEELPDGSKLAATFAGVAAKNVGRLMSVNIDWAQGTVDGKPFLNQNEASPVVDRDEAFKIGSGVHWYMLNDGTEMDGTFEGHLVPYSPNIWGAAAAYWSKVHNLPLIAWLQQSEETADKRAFW